MPSASSQLAPEGIIGRYAIYGEIASGGMATVHFGRLLGAAGFSRTVAIKRLHKQFASDPEFVAMLLDEARVCARVQHPNVVSILDVVPKDGELFLVMEYIRGETLSRLMKSMKKQKTRIPIPIAASIVSSVLHGLHAAHEAKSENGEPLHIIHRDVSPQNILVGTDGVAKVLDFGVAKAVGRAQATRTGEVKGKLSYMAPEQLFGGKSVDRRIDIYAAAIVLWEVLAGKRLIDADDDGGKIAQAITSSFVPPSAVAPEVPPELDAVVMKGLERDPDERFLTARAMAIALEDATKLATQHRVGEWVEQVAAETLGSRAELIAEIESSSSVNAVADPRNPPSPPPSAGLYQPSSATQPEVPIRERKRPPAPSLPPLPMHSQHVVDVPVASAAFDPETTLALNPPPAQAREILPSNGAPSHARKPLQPLLVGLALFLLGIGATVLFLKWTSSSDDKTAPGGGGASPVSSPAVAPTLAPVNTATADASAGARPPLVEPVASGNAPLSNGAGKSGSGGPRPGGGRPATTTGAPATAKPNSCTPPYTLDSSGIRRMKPECI